MSAVQVYRSVGGGAKGSERSLSTYVAYIEKDSDEYREDPEYEKIRKKYMNSKVKYPTLVCMDTLPPKSDEALRRESMERPHRSNPHNLRDRVTQQDKWEEIDKEKWGMKDLFPTPIADDTGMRTKPYSQGGHALSLVVGQKEGLIDKVKWRTPKAGSHGDERYNEEFARGERPTKASGHPVELTLENQIRIRESENRVAGKENWRTPDCERRGGQPERYLERMAEGNFRRPTTGTVIQLTLADQVRHSGLYPAQSKEEEQGSIQKGQLSPDWTEWLMGWPVGWTDLKPLSPEAVARWKEAMLNGTYWAVDPADLPKDHPAYLPRLTEDKVNRANRLKAIGNGQVPMCVFVFETLAREFIHDRETAETDGQE